MRTISEAELRRNLAAALDGVVENHAPVIITRGRGKPAAELVSLEDFASTKDTRELLRSPRNAARLLEATAALDRGERTARDLSE